MVCPKPIEVMNKDAVIKPEIKLVILCRLICSNSFYTSICGNNSAQEFAMSVPFIDFSIKTNVSQVNKNYKRRDARFFKKKIGQIE
jgi:hypothetical protein